MEVASNNDGESRDGALVGKASVELTRILSAVVFDFYDYVENKEREAKLEAELKVLFENADQWKANADVKEMRCRDQVLYCTTSRATAIASARASDGRRSRSGT